MTPPPVIREATAADAAELARVLSGLGYPMSAGDVAARWKSWEREGNAALVIEADGGLLGVITLHRMTVFHRGRPVGRITSLAVDERARGRGYGRALVDAAEDRFRRAGCGTVEVTSHARRVEAHSFYLHLGYERTSYRFARPLD